MMREVKERCTMAIRFSEVLGKMKGSDLGPLLALTAQPDIISFQDRANLARASAYNVSPEGTGRSGS